MEKYNVTLENVYNFDEKGFLQGLLKKAKRIVLINLLRNGGLLGVAKDGSREFISLLAAICADGSRVTPGLIYQGPSPDVRLSWLEDFEPANRGAYFACSENGWSNDDLGVNWLERVFNRETKEKAGRGWRLLILDGHHSHVNLQFIDYADRNRILLAVLPSHTTHRLQPLDVGIFGPLARAYSNALNTWM
jgi:hypothetical protein